jgi:hypothetical protein
MLLNNKMREKIARNAVENLKLKYEALHKKIESFDYREAVLNSIGTKAEIKKMIALPSGWMSQSKYFYISFPKIDLKSICIDGNGKVQNTVRDFRIDNSRIDFNDPVRYPADTGYHIELCGDIVDLARKYADAHNLMYSTMTQIYVNLKQYKTTEEMAKAWPEGKKFYAEVGPEQCVALAVRWDGINETIGADK